MVVEEKVLRVRNVAKKVIVEQLIKHQFPLIPKRRGPSARLSATDDEDGGDGDGGAEAGLNESSDEYEKGYDYLLGMPLWSLTLERVAALQRQHEQKVVEIKALENTQASALWVRDIDNFILSLDRHEKSIATLMSNQLLKMARQTAKRDLNGGVKGLSKKRKSPTKLSAKVLTGESLFKPSKKKK